MIYRSACSWTTYVVTKGIMTQSQIVSTVECSSLISPRINISSILSFTLWSNTYPFFYIYSSHCYGHFLCCHLCLCWIPPPLLTALFSCLTFSYFWSSHSCYIVSTVLFWSLRLYYYRECSSFTQMIQPVNSLIFNIYQAL